MGTKKEINIWGYILKSMIKLMAFYLIVSGIVLGFIGSSILPSAAQPQRTTYYCYMTIGEGSFTNPPANAERRCLTTEEACETERSAKEAIGIRTSPCHRTQL